MESKPEEYLSLNSINQAKLFKTSDLLKEFSKKQIEKNIL